MFPWELQGLYNKSTPRDPADFNNSKTTPRSDFYGYQGYPGGSFVTPRQRDLQEQKENDYSHYPKAHWLDTRNPKIHTGAEGLQYGSEDVNDTNKQEPRRLKNMFPDKSSAQLRTYQEMQVEVERELEKMKQEKLQKQMEREQEKKQDMEMLTSYNPWGRAGGGAPKGNAGHFKTKFTEEELANKNLLKSDMPQDYLEEHGDFFSQFGRPGAGAPLRTNSGKLRTEIAQDPMIRFQDNPAAKKAFEAEISGKSKNYDKNQYLHDLDDQLNYQKLKAQQDRIDELKREIDTLKHDPFGKPGNGAPKSRGGTEQSSNRKYVEYDPELHDDYDPWGKGFGNPRRNPDGRPERYKFSDPEHGPMTKDHKDVQGEVLDFNQSRGGAGAPVKTESGNFKTRRITTLATNDRGDATVREQEPTNVPSDEELQIFDPFGRSGAGAPIRDAKGHVVSNVYGRMMQQDDSANVRMREQNKKVYLNEIQNQMQEQKQSRDRDMMDQRAPGGDFASMVKQGQVGKPRRDPNTGMLADQRLAMSDVTKQQTDRRSWKNEDSPRYHTELEAAAAERARAQRLERDRDFHQSNHHQDTFSNFFGRQGAGAPLKDGAKKQNLENILYTPRANANGPYEKNTFIAKPQNYVRVTIPSTHANAYQVSSKLQLRKANSYNYNTPYATVPDDQI